MSECSPWSHYWCYHLMLLYSVACLLELLGGWCILLLAGPIVIVVLMFDSKLWLPKIIKHPYFNDVKSLFLFWLYCLIWSTKLFLYAEQLTFWWRIQFGWLLHACRYKWLHLQHSKVLLMVFNLFPMYFHTDVLFFKVFFLHLVFFGPLSNPPDSYWILVYNADPQKNAKRSKDSLWVTSFWNRSSGWAASIWNL